jgi:acetoin:2,6-dichlorophenolindophenol oxidoreductase subunit beta
MTTVLAALNSALRQALTQDQRVLLMGEDILDPYGGAFKVTRGLSEAFPEQVLTTPISEAGIVGVATGMAMRGLRPVVEIMFGDFVTLIADQLVNHAAKFHWMYNEQVSVPLVVRTPMGGRRGYGPTHSQTLEKLFLGVPGLRVLAPCAIGDPGQLLLDAVLEDNDPVLFIENKLLYLSQVQELANDPEFVIQAKLPESSAGQLSAGDTTPAYAPVYTLSLRGAPAASLTLTAYGYMAELARQAALRLAYEHEVFSEIVIPTQLAPFDITALSESLSRTGRLLTVEEGTHALGWGAETVAGAAEALGTRLRVARRLAALDLPVPASAALEEKILPGVNQIVQSALNIMHNR